MKKYCLFFLILFGSFLYAEELSVSSSIDTWGVDCGLGHLYISNPNLFAGNIHFFYSSNQKDLIRLGLSSSGGSATSLKVNSYEVLFGQQNFFWITHLAFLYGVSLLSIEESEGGSGWFSFGPNVEAQRHYYYAIGIPLEVELGIAPLSFLGFKCVGYANLNTWKNFSGIFIDFSVGKLW